MHIKISSAFVLLLCSNLYAELLPEVRAKEFVYLDEIAPTIKQSLRYITNYNFVGAPVEGYKTPRVVLTRQAAQALQQVQEEVQKDGYCLVVYDGYRPQKAVNHFVRWSDDINDQRQKKQYYPRVNKADVFVLGYVAKRSSHSRGSTVDLTLIKKNQDLKPIQEQNRTLLDGFIITFLNDGTVDMGSSFDLFDSASHYENDLIDGEYKEHRTYLKNVMEKHGFESCAIEWWHFTLKNEPYPANQDASYFNFTIE